MCTGQYDPQSGAEFAIAAAENGYLFVHTQLPTDSNDNLVGATMDTWFFADPPAIRWRGVKAFRNYVYTVQPTHAGIRRFIIDSKASGANRVTDLGYAHTNQLSWGLQRMHVDEENGHLYVTGYDTVVGGTALCVYDIYNENTDSVIDPPQLVGVWAPGGVIFHSFVHNDRIFLAYQKAGQPNWWQVLDRSSLPSSSSAAYFWNPLWGEWQNTLPGGSNLSHDSYISPDGSTWFTTTEAPGFTSARDISNLPPLTTAGTAIPEPAIVGTYSSSLVQLHAMEGIGSTGYVSHWMDGMHVIDLSSPGGLGNDYHLMAKYNSSTMPISNGGDGVWDCHPHQPSGVVYINDSEEGLFLVKVERGHVNRYGPSKANSISTPRISAEVRPPRLGSFFVFRLEGMEPGSLVLLSLSLSEEPNYMAGSPLTLAGITPLVDVQLASNLLFFPNSNGSFNRPYPIPNLPILTGMKLFSQLFELRLGTNSTMASSQGTWFGLSN